MALPACSSKSVSCGLKINGLCYLRLQAVNFGVVYMHACILVCVCVCVWRVLVAELHCSAQAVFVSGEDGRSSVAGTWDPPQCIMGRHPSGS